MDALSATGALSGSTAARTAQDADKPKTALNSDFETFLKMLTAQMRNQDPLNPVESTEFASQLAAFSTVEQQVLTNDLLGDLGTQLGVMGMGQLHGWVGMEARAAMPVAFDGDPVDMTLQTRPGTDLARLVVRDASGGIVNERDVPAGGGDYVWDGAGDNGFDLPEGVYTITVDSFQGDDLLGSDLVQSAARVVEARLNEGQTILVMEGGLRLPAGDVIGLRRPPNA